MPSSPQRVGLFQKSTRKNQEFERFLCDGQDSTVLNATTSKYIPLSYFVTPQAEQESTGTSSSPHRRSLRHAHGQADKMPFESFKLINLQQRGSHAHSLVLFKSRAITTNPEQIAIFDCNGQYVQSEIRVIHTQHPDADATDEPGTVYDVTQNYFSPVSPKVCLNYGNDTYNPGYCGIFGMIAMVFFRGFRPPTTASGEEEEESSSSWVKKWTLLLKYMRQDIPDEPESHGCLGTDLAAQVQEIIAAHPSTATAHQNAEQEIIRLLKQAVRGYRPPTAELRSINQ